jgi:hypothetical protein
MSKGSKRRPTDEARFGANYDRIFDAKAKYYKAMKPVVEKIVQEVGDHNLSKDDNGALLAPKWVMDGLMKRTRKLSDVKLKLKTK